MPYAGWKHEGVSDCERVFVDRNGAGKHTVQSIRRGRCAVLEGGRPNSGLSPLQPIHEIQCAGPCKLNYDNLQL